MAISRFLLGFLILSAKQRANISQNLNVGESSGNLDALDLLETIFPGDFTGSPDTFSPIRVDLIRFFLHTRNINELELTRDNLTSINFDTSKDTVFLIHGWLDGPNTSMPLELTDAYLESEDINAIVVDWSELAAVSYVTAAFSTPQVGRAIANFIQFMIENINLEMNRTSFVGHSMGAHIAGIAGRQLDGSVSSITGLDPAGPLFYTRTDDEKITRDDGQFVQIIHTNVGILGYIFSLGHADYWPNCGGPFQPGCELFGRCSHDRSFWYYGESLRTGGFKAVQCSDCSNYSLELCNNARTATMGNDTVDKSIGNFFLTTNSKPPYSRS